MANNKWYSLILVAAFIFTTVSLHADGGKLKNSRVLVYTKNGKGFVHDNIPFAVAAIKELGAAHSFTVEVSDDPAVFTQENLKKYNLLIFPSTNNDVFDTDVQRVAFRRYIEAGGGFVGIHSVTGTERKWGWFKMMVGETFTWHARTQLFSIKKVDKSHPSMKGVPDIWSREDECYMGAEMYPGIRVLMAHDLSTIDTINYKTQAEQMRVLKGSFGYYFPAVWWQPFEGGNVWVTTLGHHIASYQEPIYRNHLLQGIKFIAEKFNGINYENASALTKDDPLKK